MKTSTYPPTDVAPEGVPSQKKKPFRFKLGVALLILYPLMWLFAAVVPFLPLDVATKAALVAGDLAAAEVIFVLGVACVGKEAYQAIKARLFRKKAESPAAKKP